MTSDSNIFGQVLYHNQSIVELIGDVICPNKECRGEKCVYITSYEKNNESSYKCNLCKACCHVLDIPFKDQKPTLLLFGGDGTYCFRKKSKLDYQKEKLSPLMRQYIRQSKLSTTKTNEINNEPAPKKAKMSPNME